MSGRYTHRNLLGVEDLAPRLELDAWQQSRFPAADLGSTEVGLAMHRIKPGTRQGFAHRHERAEELFVVLAGSGRVKLDDDVVELRRLDALRIAPDVWRTWEAGPDGLDILAFGVHHEGDAEFTPEWWTD